MSYIWFNSVLDALGKRLNYESVSNLYGNSFAKDADKLIKASNPLLKNGGKQDTGIMGLAGKIKIIESKTKESGKQALIEKLGDISWAEGLPI